MKKILLIAFLTLTSMSIQAQEELTWHTDMSKATDISIKENKPMFLFFTGSDWCGWCIRLQKEVFKTALSAIQTYKSFAALHIIAILLAFTACCRKIGITCNQIIIPTF